VQAPLAQTSLAAQTLPQVPQFLGSVVVVTQVPLQSVCGLGQEQALFAQAFPPVHFTPQVPQLLMSLVRFTQTPAQSVWPVPHLLSHLLLMQSGVAAGQVVVQLPQAVGSFVVFLQVPLQSDCPDGQVQLPPTQVLPPVHLIPQSPQLSLSEPTLMQEPLQILFGAVQVVPGTQAPPWQVSVAAQALPQVPQLLPSVAVLTHLPEQSVRPPTQEHLPATQLNPAAASHFVPQAPQLLLSLWGSMQEPLQSSFGAWQVPHLPLLQDWPDGQAVPQAPQF
jgi:hypothetical protein